MNKLIEYGGTKVVVSEVNGERLIIGSIVNYGDERLVMDSGNTIVGHLSNKLERISDPSRSNEYILTQADQAQIDKLSNG